MTETTGKRIQHIRNVRGLTQTVFAELISTTQQTLSRLENDESMPTAEILIAAYKVFGIDPLWILLGISRDTDANTKAQQVHKAAASLSKELEKFTLLFDHINQKTEPKS